MIFTNRSIGVAFGFANQSIAAMLANVVERLNGAILLADHQNRFRSYFFHLKVTGIGHLTLAPEQQPDLGPHMLPFLFEKLA